MVAAPRILVVDDDAWILRMVATVLSKRGYRIETATDGEQALAAAIASPPDLVISDIMMPKMDGWAMVRNLRARRELAFVPVIFLTALGSEDDRIRGFRMGADDYLAKPFRFEELDLRVANVLRRHHQIETSLRTQAAAPPPKDGPGVTGSLDQIGLSALLVLFELERKSGIFVVSRDGETARLFLRGGRVLRARFDGKDQPRNQDVIYALLGWAAGRFEFSALEVEMPDEVGATSTHLLMEGARRMDELSAPTGPPR